MKLLKHTKTYALIAGLSAVFAASHAQAQTSVDVNLTLDNSFTVAKVSDLEFGTYVFTPGGATPADDTTFTVSTGGASSTSAAGASFAYAIDVSGATAAGITIADAAPGASISFDISNITDPTDSVDTLTLGTWQYSFNGASATGITPGSAQSLTYDAAFGGGTNTIDIGVTATAAGDGTYTAPNTTPTAYAGSFQVDLAYE